MPRINVKANIPISEEQMNQMVSEMSKVIDLIPRESGKYLMTDFEADSTIRYGNDPKEPCACVEIMILAPIFDTTDKTILEDVLARLSNIVSTVCNMPENRIYVLYRNAPLWAFEGINIEKTLFKGLL